MNEETRDLVPLSFTMNETHVDYGSTELSCATRFEAHLNYCWCKKERALVLLNSKKKQLNQNEKQEIF